MKYGQDSKQQKVIDGIESTFDEPRIVRALEMAIIREPDIFPKTNFQRTCRIARDSSKEAIRELDFICEHLPKRYKHQILRSDPFNQFLSNIFDIDKVGLSRQNEDRDLALNLATQMMLNSLDVMIKSMPVEFQKPLIDSVLPFVNLLNALSTFADRKDIEDIPKIRIPDKFYRRL